MHWIALLSAPDSAASPASPGLPADPRTALAWWALSFTPRVTLLDEAVLMEVSASERLWGGRKRLLELIFKQKRPEALVHASRAATSLVALGLLRLAASGAPKPDRIPDDLPLATLSAAQPHLATLSRIGCRTLSDVRALPRAGVARRFGAGLLDALDHAWGQRPESHVWLTLPECFDARYELPALAENANALMFGANRLLLQLRVWLQSRQLGAVAFELVWLLDARRIDGTALPRDQQLVIRTGQATQDVTHLARLLAEQLARTTLPAPVHSLRLRSLETARLALQSDSLLPEDRAAAAGEDSLQQLVERLAARLGPDQVLHAVPHADHRPELMQRWQPASNTTNLVATQTGCTRASGQKGLKNGEFLPTWLLREPLPLAVHHDRPQFHGPLHLLAGPERLEAGWWAEDGEVAPAPEPALRDYFLARSERAGLLWIYRERLRRNGIAAANASGASALAGGRWFLHGLYA